MQYYIRSTGQTIQSLPDFATPETCRDYGYWPLYDAPFTEDLRYYTRIPANVEFDEFSQTYTQYWTPVLLPLDSIKYEKAKDFDIALQEVDTKSARGDRGGLLAFYEAFEYKEPLSEKAVEDINILWELESVAQENRLMLDRLLALKVTDDMTTEEAQAVLLQAMAIEPWLPWKPKPQPEG